jgi:hypothetical protein
MFKLPGMKAAIRVYSAEQVMNLHRLAFGKFQFRKSSSLDRKVYFAEIRKVFFATTEILDENGNQLKGK